MFDREIFNKAIKFTLQIEGYLSDDKDDPGGLTKFGISKRRYPNLDIENLTKEQAIEIYYQDYWKRIKCDVICTISPRLSIIIFDTEVNSGNGIRLLQSTIRSYNKEPFNKIKVDGIFGPHTKKLCTDLYHIAPNYLIYNYLINRISYYNMITRKNKKFLKFINGWINRVIKLRNYIENVKFD